MISSYKMSYHPERDSRSKRKTKAELDLSDYAAKSEVKKQQLLIHQDLLKRLIHLV